MSLLTNIWEMTKHNFEITSYEKRIQCREGNDK